jgi:hypothetical protein
MILGSTASTSFYGIAYSLQLVAVVLTATSLWSIRKRFRTELDALWAMSPDPVITWVAARRKGVRLWFVAALIRLHIRRPRMVTKVMHDHFSMTDSATASAAAATPLVFDSSAEIAPQFDALANLVGITRQTVMDLDNRLQETINDERRVRSEDLKQLDDKMRAVSFGGFGWAVVGAALLVVSIVLELVANFV